MTTKIDLPNHLSEYLRGKFGDKDGIVCLPSNSSLYFIVYEITRRRPAGKPTDNGNTEIRLPSPALSHQTGGKPVEYFNYISESGADLLAKHVNTMMKVEAHELFDENKHVRGIDYIDTSYAFLERYRIESLTPEALLKDYLRWRKKIGRSVSIRKKRRSDVKNT